MPGVETFEFRQLIEQRFHAIGELHDQPRAVGRVRVAPGRERGAGRGHGLVDIGGFRLGNRGELGSVVGVHDGDARAVGGLDEFAVDKQLVTDLPRIDGTIFFEHAGLLRQCG